jgi:hypothetical protein
VQNNSFIGNYKYSEIYFSNDALGIGNLSEYLSATEQRSENANHITEIPPNSSPPSQITPEVLEEFRQYLEIVSAAGSFFIIVLILALCIYRVVNRWDQEARNAIFPTYRSSEEYRPDTTVGQGREPHDDFVVTWTSNLGERAQNSGHSRDTGSTNISSEPILI